MTITRLWQAGAEFNNPLVEFTTRDNTAFTTSSSKARTGTYSIRTQSNRHGTQVLATTYTQLRLGFFVNHNGATAGDSPSLFQLRNGSTVVVDVRWDGDNSTLQLYVGATEQDTALSAAFAQTDTWLHVGIDCNIASSGGWVVVYLDGVEVLSYTGATDGGAASIDTLIIGSPRSFQYWETYIYYDDLYIDNLSGEANAAVVPDYRFVPITPNGNGSSSQWVGNDADSTDNYLLVDEIPPDGDTTYVETDIGGHSDEYEMSDVSVPSGYEISAVIPMAYAKKLNAGGSLNLKVKTRTTVGGSPYTATSSAMALGTDYTLIWERRALRPDGGAWDETTVNVAEIGMIAD